MAVGALHREPPACANTVTQSQKDEVGHWGDPGAFGYLSMCFPPALPLAARCVTPKEDALKSGSWNYFPLPLYLLCILP